MMVGYRTYMVAAALLGMAGAMVMGVDIPEEVWPVLAALGLGGMRAAIDGK